jgi:hypothetical protein
MVNPRPFDPPRFKAIEPVTTVKTGSIPSPESGYRLQQYDGRKCLELTDSGASLGAEWYSIE